MQYLLPIALLLALLPYYSKGIGALGAGVIDIEDMYKLECVALPGTGCCSAMFTACTMASVVGAPRHPLPSSKRNSKSLTARQRPLACVPAAPPPYPLSTPAAITVSAKRNARQTSQH